MIVEITQEGKVITAVVKGHLDYDSAPEFESQIEPFISVGPVELIFDFISMDYISSAGLRVVLICYNRVIASGGSVVIKNLCEDVRSVFDITGFSNIMGIE